MGSSLVRRLIVLCAIFAMPAVAFAQEAVLTGTVTDSTGAVLPGVTVQAVHEASGNSFEAVTDARGAYRIPVRIGTYRITARALRLHHGHADRRGAAGRTDVTHQPADGAVDAWRKR